MPAYFLNPLKDKISFIDYMSLIEATNMKALLRRAAEQRSEQKLKDIVQDYQGKVDSDNKLLNIVEDLPVISDNPSLTPETAEKVKLQEAEKDSLGLVPVYMETQPIIFRDAPFNQVVTANFDSFINAFSQMTDPDQYEMILDKINQQLAEPGTEFDIDTKDNKILGLANRYAYNAQEAKKMRNWTSFNFYLRGLAYFIPLLIEKANLDREMFVVKVESKLREIVAEDCGDDDFEVEAITEQTFNKMSSGEKLQYLKEHPNSKFIKDRSKYGRAAEKKLLDIQDDIDIRKQAVKDQKQQLQKYTNPNPGRNEQLLKENIKNNQKDIRFLNKDKQKIHKLVDEFNSNKDVILSVKRDIERSKAAKDYGALERKYYPRLKYYQERNKQIAEELLALAEK